MAAAARAPRGHLSSGLLGHSQPPAM